MVESIVFLNMSKMDLLFTRRLRTHLDQSMSVCRPETHTRREIFLAIDAGSLFANDISQEKQ